MQDLVFRPQNLRLLQVFVFSLRNIDITELEKGFGYAEQGKYLRVNGH